jgi:hypothetical protein
MTCYDEARADCRAARGRAAELKRLARGRDSRTVDQFSPYSGSEMPRNPRHGPTPTRPVRFLSCADGQRRSGPRQGDSGVEHTERVKRVVARCPDGWEGQGGRKQQEELDSRVLSRWSAAMPACRGVARPCYASGEDRGAVRARSRAVSCRHLAARLPLGADDGGCATTDC